MSDFDREALVAAANAGQKQDSNLGFYGAVAALPIIGIAIGAFFMTSAPKQAPAAPYAVAEQAAPETEPTVVAAAQSQSLGEEVLADAQIQAGLRAPEEGAPWSAAAEMGRYSIARRSLMECGRVANFDYSVTRNFTTKNAEAYEKLQAIKSAEWKAGRSDRRRKVQQANNEMMVGLFTGETQMKALEMSFEHQRMMKEMEASRGLPGQPTVRKTDPAVLALLGGEPDLAKCTKLKIDIQRGKHDIAFENRS